MNPTLAALYGLDKTASDNEQEEIDLSQISAADFLKGVEDGTIVLPEDEQEKQASDGELDLSEISLSLGRPCVSGKRPRPGNVSRR